MGGGLSKGCKSQKKSMRQSEEHVTEDEYKTVSCSFEDSTIIWQVLTSHFNGETLDKIDNSEKGLQGCLEILIPCLVSNC